MMIKKALLILCLILLGSCSKDEETEKFPVDIVFNNVAVISGKIYTTIDYPLEILSVEGEGLEKIEYVVDNHRMWSSIFPPFGARFKLEEGEHVLTITINSIKLLLII